MLALTRSAFRHSLLRSGNRFQNGLGHKGGIAGGITIRRILISCKPPEPVIWFAMRRRFLFDAWLPPKAKMEPSILTVPELAINMAPPPLRPEMFRSNSTSDPEAPTNGIRKWLSIQSIDRCPSGKPGFHPVLVRSGFH